MSFHGSPPTPEAHPEPPSDRPVMIRRLNASFSDLPTIREATRQPELPTEVFDEVFLSHLINLRATADGT